jgi:hypothetical protein
MITTVLLGNGYQIYADTAVDTQNSTSSSFINVVAPGSNAFYLKTNPENFDFGTIPVDFTTKNVSETATISPFQVVNITGNGQKFELQAQLSDFTGIGTTNSGIDLPLKDFIVTVGDSSDGAMTGTGNSGVNIYKQAGILLNGGVDATGLIHSGNVSAQIDIDATQIRNFDSFQGTINYSLVNGI